MGGLTIAGTGTVNSLAGQQAIVDTMGNAATINNAVQGSGGLTKAGAGTLTLGTGTTAAAATLFAAGGNLTLKGTASVTTNEMLIGADSSFMSFEARKSTELGDTLQQLRVSNPPILAVIRGNGEVAELYTGWIGRKVMEQVVADAVRGF